MVEDRFKIFEADGLFNRTGHVESQRFAEPKRGLEDTPVKPADDQDRRSVTLFREETKQLDAVHPRHSEVERHGFWSGRLKSLTKFGVVGGDDGLEPALASRIGEKVGKRRLIIDQQQAGLRQIDLLLPTRRVHGKHVRGQAEETPF
jgi:hypothetical protein